MSNDKKQMSKARQALVDRVLSRLDEGAMPWDNGMQGVSELPRNAVTNKPYRGVNVLNLMLSFKSDPRWLTFNQAQENGYAVKKGAKGVPIELYKTIDRRTGKDADFDAIREEIKGMTFDERQVFKKENLQSFARSYYVFNASDVHGIEPYRASQLTQTDISRRNGRIEAVIATSEAPIFYDGNGRNYYSPSADEIHLTERSAFKSDEFFYNTALHEMGHSTGHKSRLNREGGNFGSKAYAREELVAEMSSVLAAAEFGLNHSDRIIENSAEYVRSWATLIRDNPQTLIDAAFDASHATDYICSKERQIERIQEETQKQMSDSEYRVISTIAGNTPVSQKSVNVEWVAIASTENKDTVLKIAEKYGSTIADGEMNIPDELRQAYNAEWARRQELPQDKAQKDNAQPNTSPLYAQYAAVQNRHPDSVVVMRVGDFYEVMGGKARDVANELDLTLTGRDVGLPERVPMCGFPHHAAEKYIEKILENRSVAVIENEGDEKYILSHSEAQKTPFEALADEKSAQKENLQSSVKEWYSHAYPTDELADVLEDKATFGSVRDAIRSGKDIYTELGSADSVVRERVFTKLADIVDVPYKAVYGAWINGAEKTAQREPRVASEQAKPPQENAAHKKPLVVNFYAGPSSGKTTVALELTAALKKAGYNVEYVSEYAKELVLENRAAELSNQRSVSDEQFRRLDRLRGSADVIVTDSPVMLGLVYGAHNGISDEYAKQIRGYYDSFDNFNMFVERPTDAAFQTEGRVHDRSQSIALDGEIKAMLEKQKIFYGNYKRDDIAKTVERITTTYNRLYGGSERTQKEKSASSSSTTKSHNLKTCLDHIPDAMKALPSWVAFRTELVDGKVKKILLSPNKGATEVKYLKWAKSDDPTTWATFDKATAFAQKYKLDGLAFSMSGSGMTCIDLDHSLDEKGKPSELAQKFINAADQTYIEQSVSGRGLHIFYAGNRPSGHQNRNIDRDIEVYDDKRFISMTGNYNGCDKVSAPSAELTNLLKSNLAKLQQYAAPSAPLGLSDNELIDKIRNSKVGRDFDALWTGNDVCGDHSVSDFKLCNMLAFFSGGDAAQVERVFKSSGLYRPKKGDAYVRRTAEKACATLTHRYEPKAYSKQKNDTRKGTASGNSGRGSSGR